MAVSPALVSSHVWLRQIVGQKQGELMRALDDYNRAVRAANALTDKPELVEFRVTLGEES